MICIIAGRYAQAKKWAAYQQLADNEWFCPENVDDLYSRENFHVVVLEGASEIPSPEFERLFHIAQIRGRMNRK